MWQVVVADVTHPLIGVEFLSRIESITAPPFYNILAASQDSDDKLQTLLSHPLPCGLRSYQFWYHGLHLLRHV
jgi:hypothetical protein